VAPGLVFEDPATGAFLFQNPYDLVHGGRTVPEADFKGRAAALRMRQA
jgi:hypothetical protein